ncbi:MAG: hypothetical protein HC798_00340 [Polaribacter sp.]|nr:hypothetical protein [Polaribacter sp.]
MKNPIILPLIGLIIITASFTEKNKKNLLDIKNIYAWCIVPFDSENRSPNERISMLKELGIKRYAYDWRKKDLETMASELTLAKKWN